MAFALLRLLTLASFIAAASLAELTVPCPQHRCGDDVEIRYPFWLDDGGTSGTTCGYPTLRFECRRDTAVLRLPSGEYAVRRIRYGNRTLTVVDFAVTSGPDSSCSCPHDLAGRNLTLPPGSPAPLSLTARNSNLTFFVGCSFVGLAARYTVPCLQNGEQSTYVFRDGRVPYEYAALCEDVVGLPVLNPDDDIVPALQEGFELSWSRPADGDECWDCEQAGGLCGHRRDTSRFACFPPTSPAPRVSVNRGSSVLKIVLPIMGTLSVLGVGCF